MYLVISTSLNPASLSRQLAIRSAQLLSELSPQVRSMDLAEFSLPFCDGGQTHAHPDVQRVGSVISRALGIILAAPIYSYDVAPATRNLVQLTGKAWSRKVVGFTCVAGGPVSYTSVLSLANSLMLDYRSFVLPDFVFAKSDSFAGNGQLIDEDLQQQLRRLARTMTRVTEALKNA